MIREPVLRERAEADMQQLTLDGLGAELLHQPAEPCDHTPTPAELRRAELSDLRDQAASVYGLYTADTVPTRHYL